jgi:glycerol-3-phosphate O-acyltransferase
VAGLPSVGPHIRSGSALSKRQVCQLPLPFIAAGEDFLGILFVRWAFRNGGAFFIRRQFEGDQLYQAIFQEYVTRLLQDGISLEFFVEGTRSRSGKMLHPKLGMLSYITSAYLDGKIANATIVPMSINYERTMEGNSYSRELLGDKKLKESLRNLIQAGSSVLNTNFGKIFVGFGRTIYIAAY